jgi:hypothetical protein
MKKIFTILAVILLPILLVACESADTSPVSDYNKPISQYTNEELTIMIDRTSEFMFSSRLVSRGTYYALVVIAYQNELLLREFNEDR